MKKPKGYWDRVSKLLFRNVALMIVVRYLTFFAWRFDLFVSGNAWSEWRYLFDIAVILLTGSVAGQLYCLKKWEKEESIPDQVGSEE